MIIDVPRFIREERQYWAELEKSLDRLEVIRSQRMALADVKRFHYLYQRASSDLAKIATFAAEPELRGYLEALVARAYGEVHEGREKANRLAPLRWLFVTFPCTFRKHLWAFALALGIMLAGAAFGGIAVTVDPEAREAFLSDLPHLSLHPAERVKREEEVSLYGENPRASAEKAFMTSFYFTHNTRVAVRTLALGVSWGIGTALVLFSNGVLLGAVAADYIWAGETAFLAGWLLPHGSVEIPAILLAGQAGLLLGRALIGYGKRSSVRQRLREIRGDLVTLTGGTAVLLLCAGFVEAFLSQYHEPVLPYSAKIAVGIVELILLSLFLARCGSARTGTTLVASRQGR